MKEKSERRVVLKCANCGGGDVTISEGRGGGDAGCPSLSGVFDVGCPTLGEGVTRSGSGR